jgi:F0F1-type ATP synthase membrane subunit b/b'
MFGKFQRTIAMMMALFGYKAESDIPINAELKALDLTDDQKAKLEAHFGKDYTKKMLDGMNTEIKAFMENNMDIKAIQDEIDALIQESAVLAEEVKPSAGDPAAKEDVSAKLAAIGANQKKLERANAELQAQVQKLMNEGVGDVPEAVIKITKDAIAKHSATHLHATNKSWDAFEKRSWNARLRDGSIKATDFSSDGNIPLLQDDLEHFVRENPAVLNSLFNDFADLPKEWDRRTGVLDRVADGFIIPAEIVQGRSKGWKEKGKFKIDAEQGRVFRKKIDITFDGFELQEIENTWIRQYNAGDGSHPWKMSFIGFLLGELVKRQKLDDRRAQINGIFSQTPDGDGKPGAAVNSQDGLRFLFWYYRDVVKKYRAVDLGIPTTTNIVDYVRNLILSIPEDERAEPGLELGLSQAWLDAYRVRAGLVYQMHKNTDSGSARYDKDYPIDYPNILFQPLKDMTKTDFMYITQSNNIQIMDYNVNEKSKFTITHEKRDTNIFADYRLGIRLKYVGTKLAQGDPAEFERQKVWSNSVPVFDKDTTVPLFDDATGIVNFHYANMKVDAAWVTDITEVENAPKGMIVKIVGNTGLVANKYIKDGAAISLTGDADFNLKLGGALTLKVQDDGTLKEIKRTTAPEAAASTDVTFTTSVLDANAGNVFRSAVTANTTLTDILNGVESKEITIYGKTGFNTIVVDVANKIEVVTTATMANETSYIKLTLIDGVWHETKRAIA